jgi:prolyl-tRNA synthetase
MTSSSLLLLRGDHELNEVKAASSIGTFRFRDDAEIRRALGCPPGYIGPVGIAGIRYGSSPTARSRR